MKKNIEILICTLLTLLLIGPVACDNNNDDGDNSSTTTTFIDDGDPDTTTTTTAVSDDTTPEIEPSYLGSCYTNGDRTKCTDFYYTEKLSQTRTIDEQLKYIQSDLCSYPIKYEKCVTMDTWFNKCDCTNASTTLSGQTFYFSNALKNDYALSDLCPANESCVYSQNYFTKGDLVSGCLTLNAEYFTCIDFIYLEDYEGPDQLPIAEVKTELELMCTETEGEIVSSCYEQAINIPDHVHACLYEATGSQISRLQYDSENTILQGYGYGSISEYKDSCDAYAQIK